MGLDLQTQSSIQLTVFYGLVQVSVAASIKPILEKHETEQRTEQSAFETKENTTTTPTQFHFNFPYTAFLCLSSLPPHFSKCISVTIYAL